MVQWEKTRQTKNLGFLLGFPLHCVFRSLITKVANKQAYYYIELINTHTTWNSAYHIIHMPLDKKLYKRKNWVFVHSLYHQSVNHPAYIIQWTINHPDLPTAFDLISAKALYRFDFCAFLGFVDGNVIVAFFSTEAIMCLGNALF